MTKFPMTHGLVLATMGLGGLAGYYAINEINHKNQMESETAKFAHEEKLMVLSQHLNSLKKKEVEDLPNTLKKIAKDFDDMKEAIVIMKEWKVAKDN